MKSRIEQGIERWSEAAVTLNSIIQQQGHIDINNREIWNGFLHDWDNEDWTLVIEALGELYSLHRGFFKAYHKEAMINATKTLMDRGHEHPRILDTKPYKGLAWRMLMTLREVWNHSNDLYIPNYKKDTQ